MMSVIYLLFVLTWARTAIATRAQGSLSYTSESQGMLHYMTRFGVGKGRDFFVYGEVTRSKSELVPFYSRMVLALLPQQTWDYLYSNASQPYTSCDKLLSDPLENSRLDDYSECKDKNHTMDYLRIVPCEHKEGDFRLCNQPTTYDVVEGYDFTYQVAAAPQTEFYYLVFLTCSRNFTKDNECGWTRTVAITVQYNIHLVNSRPNQSNPYTNEFSYELEGVLTLQLFFTMSYLLLATVHFLLHVKCCKARSRYSMHILVKVFSGSLVLEALYVFTELIHISIYAGNGKGEVTIQYLGEVCNQFSDWLLILVVILVGKGWQVTTSSLRWSKVTMLIWGAYIVFSGIFFIWTVVSDQVYPLSLGLYRGYQSWAGGLYLGYRLFVLVYLLYEMRQVYLIENRSTALRLYIVLAVCYIIWFSYLPMLTLLALAVNPVKRFLVVSSVYLVFDLLINVGMVTLFCPRWANRYFQFDHYINVLSQSSNTYRSLKSYGGSDIPAPI